MLKNSDADKSFFSRKNVLFLISIFMNILMIILMLFDIANYFFSISTIILAKDSLVDIESSLFGLNFITKDQNFYFQFKVTIYLIILLIYDLTLIITFLGFEIYKKYKSNRQ